MPATVKTVEYFEKDIKKEKIERERDLRIKAGAIRSKIKEEPNRWVLTSEWNVIGEQ